MLKNKKKVKIVALSTILCLLVFSLGVCIGAKYFGIQNKKIQFEAKIIRFYTIKKMLGKTITSDEKNVIGRFQENTEKCMNDLSTEEKNKVDIITNEVLSLAKNNDKVTFRLKDLKSLNRKELITLAKKIKRCNVRGVKALKKDERKILRIATSKMKIDDVIKLYNGIK